MTKLVEKFEDLTEHQKKAILIIGEAQNVRPRQFARLFWPDSDGWHHATKAGPHGSTRGGGMNLAGGGYLGKLTRMGLVRHNVTLEVRRGEYGPIYTLSDKGLEFYNKLKREGDDHDNQK